MLKIRLQGTLKDIQWFSKKARADTRRTLAEKTSEMPESLSGLSEPASGMERTVCTKNTDRRMA